MEVSSRHKDGWVDEGYRIYGQLRATTIHTHKKSTRLNQYSTMTRDSEHFVNLSLFHFIFVCSDSHGFLRVFCPKGFTSSSVNQH